jgi:hypothetical protein
MNYIERKMRQEHIITSIANKEPTIITCIPSISRGWYVNGVLHREDGPAIMHVGGSEFWYYKGKFMGRDNFTVETFQRYIKMKAFW